MIPDEPFWSAADEATAAIRRRMAELTAKLAVDADGKLDATGRMLQLKRGCRAMTAAIVEWATDPQSRHDPHTYTQARITAAGLNAALPHIIQALANDAYQSPGFAALTAGDWLTGRHADLLEPLDET